jgi:hypothetical protein
MGSFFAPDCRYFAGAYLVFYPIFSLPGSNVVACSPDLYLAMPLTASSNITYEAFLA